MPLLLLMTSIINDSLFQVFNSSSFIIKIAWGLQVYNGFIYQTLLVPLVGGECEFFKHGPCFCKISSMWINCYSLQINLFVISELVPQKRASYPGIWFKGWSNVGSNAGQINFLWVVAVWTRCFLVQFFFECTGQGLGT